MSTATRTTALPFRGPLCNRGHESLDMSLRNLRQRSCQHPSRSGTTGSPASENLRRKRRVASVAALPRRPKGLILFPSLQELALARRLHWFLQQTLYSASALRPRCWACLLLHPRRRRSAKRSCFSRGIASSTGANSRHLVQIFGCALSSDIPRERHLTSKRIIQGVTELQRVTPAQLALHKSREDAWSSFNGRVYNITPYLRYHPGGIGELMRVAGRDGQSPPLWRASCSQVCLRNAYRHEPFQ
jgi:Cytochrome b5-like Heme/Steroid binding domain